MEARKLHKTLPWLTSVLSVNHSVGVLLQTKGRAQRSFATCQWYPQITAKHKIEQRYSSASSCTLSLKCVSSPRTDCLETTFTLANFGHIATNVVTWILYAGDRLFFSEMFQNESSAFACVTVDPQRYAFSVAPVMGRENCYYCFILSLFPWNRIMWILVTWCFHSATFQQLVD